MAFDLGKLFYLKSFEHVAQSWWHTFSQKKKKIGGTHGKRNLGKLSPNFFSK